MRVFFAIEPPDAIRAALASLAAQLAKKEFRATATDQLHITLRFFGAAREADVDKMSKAAREVCASTKPFDLAIAGAGSFGKRDVPHVVWAGVVDASGALADFARNLDKALASVGLARGRDGGASPPAPAIAFREAKLPATAREERESTFAPHVTIARLRSSNPRARAVRFDAASLGDVACGTFRVDEIVLFSSKTAARGAVHTPLARFHFG